MTPRVASSEHSAEVEAAIIDAARDLLAEMGPGGLSMRGVAERVGITATAIYRHFASKDELLDRVVHVGYERYGEYLQSAVRPHPRGSFERLRALGEAYLRFALENEAYFRVLFSLQPPHRRDVADLPGGGYQVLRETIAEGVASGALRPADPDVVAHYLWALAHGLVTIGFACRMGDHVCAAGSSRDAPLELFRAFTPFVEDGLRAGNGHDANGLVTVEEQVRS